MNIRLKELEMFRNCFTLMGSLSAMLAGFSYSEISVPTYNQTDNTLIVRFFYLAGSVSTLSFGLIIILISSFSNIFGTGLALRGNQGANSVSHAVKTIEGEFTLCLRFFIL